jgi:hypothetical protein
MWWALTFRASALKVLSSVSIFADAVAIAFIFVFAVAYVFVFLSCYHEVARQNCKRHRLENTTVVKVLPLSLPLPLSLLLPCLVVMEVLPWSLS